MVLRSIPLATPSCEKHAKALQLIEEWTTDAAKIQEKVLAEILSQNAEVEYLKIQNLGRATDRETFKSKVPVVTYEDLQPYIQRIANGDHSSILTAHPISELFTSSGTSGGEPKLIPAIQDDHDRRKLLYSLLMPIMDRYVPGLDKGKVLFFMFVRCETTTPGGFVARPMLTSYYKSDQFKNRPYDPYQVYCSPNEAILCPDSFQSLYTQMLCGLLEREQVLRLGAIFASILLRAIRFLQLHWRVLANDIETGTLNPQIKDPSIRHLMSKILEPNHELAEFIRTECSKENWEGIITRIWPNTKYLDAIVTGAMAQYIPMLDFYSGGLPIVCTRYATSECPLGVNLNPMCKPSEVSYTLMPNMAYFEFIPQEPGSSEKLVDLVDVELGKEYELVFTTYAGLYRYRLGDILRVTGFHNSAPQFSFVRRKNTLLSIDADKTDEVELQNGIENASRLLHEFNTRVVDFTSYADTSSIPGHYVIYWELLARDLAKYPTNEVLNQCCLAIEESLNTVYRQERVVENLIGPLEIRVVKDGTFEELMDYAVSRGASINQYKTPRCVNFTPFRKLLDSRVISVHFSPALPHWSPERKW